MTEAIGLFQFMIFLAAVIGISVVVSFVLGWFLSYRNFKTFYASYDDMRKQVQRLQNKYDEMVTLNMSLTQDYYKLEALYNQAIQEIAKLSAEQATHGN